MSAIVAVMFPACEDDADLDLDGDACPDCEGAGEVLDIFSDFLMPCPAWCAAAHRLYDDRGDHDRSKD